MPIILLLCLNKETRFIKKLKCRCKKENKHTVLASDGNIAVVLPLHFERNVITVIISSNYW